MQTENAKHVIDDIARIMNECCNRYDEQGNHLGNKCGECEEWSDDNHCCCSYNRKEAEALYNAGYRKQSKGVWEIVKGSNGKEKMVCTNCRHQQDLASTFTYCPNCAAKMGGGE